MINYDTYIKQAFDTITQIQHENNTDEDEINNIIIELYNNFKCFHNPVVLQSSLDYENLLIGDKFGIEVIENFVNCNISITISDSTESYVLTSNFDYKILIQKTSSRYDFIVFKNDMLRAIFYADFLSESDINVIVCDTNLPPSFCEFFVFLFLVLLKERYDNYSKYSDR